MDCKKSPSPEDLLHCSRCHQWYCGCETPVSTCSGTCELNVCDNCLTDGEHFCQICPLFNCTNPNCSDRTQLVLCAGCNESPACISCAPQSSCSRCQLYYCDSCKALQKCNSCQQLNCRNCAYTLNCSNLGYACCEFCWSKATIAAMACSKCTQRVRLWSKARRKRIEKQSPYVTPKVMFWCAQTHLQFFLQSSSQSVS